MHAQQFNVARVRPTRDGIWDRRTAFVDDIETSMGDVVILQIVLTLRECPDEDRMVLR